MNIPNTQAGTLAAHLLAAIERKTGPLKASLSNKILAALIEEVEAINGDEKAKARRGLGLAGFYDRPAEPSTKGTP